jgi:hypothetical protein
VTALVLTLGVAPMLTSGADHLDAPSLGSISVNPNDEVPPRQLSSAANGHQGPILRRHLAAPPAPRQPWPGSSRNVAVRSAAPQLHAATRWRLISQCGDASVTDK